MSAGRVTIRRQCSAWASVGAAAELDAEQQVDGVGGQRRESAIDVPKATTLVRNAGSEASTALNTAA